MELRLSLPNKSEIIKALEAEFKWVIQHTTCPQTIGKEEKKSAESNLIIRSVIKLSSSKESKIQLHISLHAHILSALFRPTSDLICTF